ncbi:DegT/DnrJ/EryC1/StrS family aminotransferase [Synechococcus sp. AH-224-G16]|nr:DegT/DnrJ/EryC1/StrS family aminotransferase [Synechococcus sp. AH-224-G16]
MATYKGRPLGSIGDLGYYPFHETKNIISGEGGALLINNSAFADRAEIIREKGTNRNQFFRGQVDKYTWVDIGSSYLPGELISAFLLAQFEEAMAITSKRLSIWNKYHHAFEKFEVSGRLRRPIIADYCEHNAHMYYILLKDLEDRSQFISQTKESGIGCVFHYVPLHSSQFIKGDNDRPQPELCVTDGYSDRLVRLPLWIGLHSQQNDVVQFVCDHL